MRYKKSIKSIIRFDKNHTTTLITFCTEDNKQVKNLAKKLKKGK